MQKIAFIIPGYDESHKRQKGYDKIAEFFEERGIKPIHIDIDWHSRKPRNFKHYVDQFLRKYKKPAGAKVYILGFSYGAITAFLSEPKTKSTVIILCSLSPYFKEDLPKLPKKWLAHWNKNFKNDGCSFNELAPKIRTKVFIVVGSREGHEVERRAKSAKKLIRRSSLFIAKGAKHSVSQKKYLAGVKRAIQRL